MKVFSHSFWAMNTRFVIVIPGLDQHTGSELSKGAELITEEWEQRLSRFRSNSELSQLNEKAYEMEFDVSPEMAEVLSTCTHYYHETGGLFDPAFSTVYDQIRANAAFNKEQLDKLQQNCGWRHVDWDEKKQKIRYQKSDVKLDFGGIGKGIALREVVAYLKEHDINSAFLSFGESSIAGIGSHPHGDYWPVSNSNVEGNTIEDQVFQLKDEFLSVSGLQTGADDLKAHIYHPHKGHMVNETGEVMVKAHCPIETEVLSTVGYLATDSEKEWLKSRFPKASWHFNRTAGTVK